MLISASSAQCDFALQLLRFRYFKVTPDESFSPFLYPFTTAALQLLQRRAVWQPHLYGVADTSQWVASLLRHVKELRSLTSRHKQRAQRHKERVKTAK